MKMYLGVDKYRLVWYTIPRFAEKSGKTKQIWRKKMSRDTQKSKVYKWEKEFFGDNAYSSVWTEDQCVKYINEAYKWWTSNKDANPIKVKFLNAFNRQSPSYFSPDDNLIGLQKNVHTNPIICSHELAHYIEHNDVCRGEASHGPVFMRVMLTLIDKFTEHSLGDMIKSARAAKVKVAGLKVPNSNKAIRKPSNTFYIPQLTAKDLKEKYIHYTVYSYDAKKWIAIDPSNLNQYLDEDYAIVDPNNIHTAVAGYEYKF